MSKPFRLRNDRSRTTAVRLLPSRKAWFAATPQNKGGRLPDNVGILVSRGVLRPRQSGFEPSTIQHCGPCLIHRDLDCFGVGVERVIEVEIFAGQALFSVVLREAPQNSAVTPRGVADDLPTCLSWGDGHRLKNDPSGPVHPWLHDITLAQMCRCEHVRPPRYDAAGAHLTHIDHGHAPPPT